MRNSSTTSGFFPQLRTTLPVATAIKEPVGPEIKVQPKEVSYQFLVHPEKKSIYAAEQLAAAAPELQLPLQLHPEDAATLITLLSQQHGQAYPTPVALAARLQALDGFSWIYCELVAHSLPGDYKDLLGWHVQAYLQKQQQKEGRILYLLSQLYHAGLWQYDQHTETITLDKGLQKMLRLERISFSLHEWLAFIHPDDVKRLYKKVFNLQRKVGLFHLNIRFRVNAVHPYRYLSFSAAAFTEEAGTMTLAGLCFDITHEKQLRNTNNTHNNLLEELQTQGNIGSFEWNPDARQLVFTRQIRHILHLAKDEEITLSYLQSRLSATDFALLTEAYQSLLAGKTKQELMLTFNNPDGTASTLWMLAHAYFHEGCLQVMSGIVQDITRLNPGQQQLKDRLLAGLLHHLPLMVMAVNLDHRVVSVYGSGLKKWGLGRKKLLGRRIAEVLPEFEQPLRQTVSNYRLSFTLALHRQPYNIQLFNFFYYDEEQQMLFGFCMDKSKEKQADELAIYLEQLEHRYQLMDTFVHAVAHDLRSPVVNLDMLLALLKEEGKLEDQSRYITAMNSGVQHLKRTLDALIEILRIEKDSLVSAENINFGELLQDLELDYKEKLAEAHGMINVYMQCDSIRYNKAYLTSILRNLISNAIKYSYPDRPARITVCAERKGSLVLLIVQDNGIGMDLNKWGHLLFKPFKRLNNHRAGTGIGLHLVKQIIEKNGGKIKVKSKPGEGTTFFCFLRPYA